MEGDQNDIYGECLKNHAATLGHNSTDGCCEYTVDDTTPHLLLCAACGCHRNFHRKITYVTVAGCPGGCSGNRAQVPEVIELLDEEEPEKSPESDLSVKRRPRTKFTEEQKERMYAFAEKIGWKLTRKDRDNQVENFCKEIGVERKSFKVWMHNHKNTASSSCQGSS